MFPADQGEEGQVCSGGETDLLSENEGDGVDKKKERKKEKKRDYDLSV